MFIFIIVITLLVFLLVVVVSFALIGNKMIGRLRNRKKGLLTTYYTERINRILFEELPEQHYHKDMDIYHDLVANLFEPTQRDLEGLSLFQKSIRRDVIEQTMITMARDLTGETRYRLTFGYRYLGFVRAEMNALHSSYWWIRARACRYLSLMQSQEAIGQISALLDDDREDVELEAALALLDLAGVDALSPILTHIETMSRWMSIHLARSIIPMGINAVPHLLKSLAIVPPHIKLFCVEVMGELGDISVVQSLIDLMKRADENLLNAILISLGKLGDRSAVPVLRDYLGHEKSTVRLAAAKGVEFLASPELILPLRHIIESDLMPVRLAAGAALHRCESGGREALIELSQQHDETVRLVALQFLEEDYTQHKTPRRW